MEERWPNWRGNKRCNIQGGKYLIKQFRVWTSYMFLGLILITVKSRVNLVWWITRETEQGVVIGTGDNSNMASWTHLVLQIAHCFLTAWPWPQADGICGLGPSPKQGPSRFGRPVWHWESPGFSFVLSYESEQPTQAGLSASCWGCTYECELGPCSGLAAWT